MKVFIDFDDVIFNTRRFVADYKKIFFIHGISEELFSYSYYQDYPKKIKGKLKKYDPAAHLKVMERTAKKQMPQLRQDINKFLKETRMYLFPDSLNFLKSFNKKELFLVSFGDARFQKMKIRSSGIQPFFQKVMITDKMKAKEIKKIQTISIKEEKLFFIDDRIDQIDAVKSNIPEITTFHLKRKQERYDDEKTKNVDHSAKSLKKVQSLIKKINGK
jgi:FMN phosphatase YigB (HAD superfamily)